MTDEARPLRRVASGQYEITGAELEETSPQWRRKRLVLPGCKLCGQPVKKRGRVYCSPRCRTAGLRPMYLEHLARARKVLEGNKPYRNSTALRQAFAYKRRAVPRALWPDGLWELYRRYENERQQRRREGRREGTYTPHPYHGGQ